MTRRLAALTGLGLLAGCAAQQPPVATAPTARLYAFDLEGAAKDCTVPQPVSLSADKPAEVTMAVGNDGGWCGVLVNQPGPGLVATRPQNGRLLIRKIGDRTRVDYIPNPAYGGPDAFAVRILPADAMLRVAVNVTYTPPPAPPAPPAPPPRAPARRR